MIENPNNQVKALKFIRDEMLSFVSLVDGGFDLTEDIDFALEILNCLVSEIMFLFPYSPEFLHTKSRRDDMDEFLKDFYYPLKKEE